MTYHIIINQKNKKNIDFHKMINHIDLKCERKNVKTIRWIVVIEMVRFERIFSKKKASKPPSL